MLAFKDLTVATMCYYVSLSSRGDQILEVNSVNVRHAALSKVHAILSKCPPGPVRLVIGRHPNPKVSYLTLLWVWGNGLAACAAHDSVHTWVSLLHGESSLSQGWVSACDWGTWEGNLGSGHHRHSRKFYWEMLSRLFDEFKIWAPGK